MAIEEENIVIEKDINDEINYIDEDEKEIVISNITNEIKILFKQAKMKKDFDFIIKKYNIKMLRKNKLVSPLREKMIIKKAIISFKINEPEDIFYYDTFITKNK